MTVNSVPARALERDRMRCSRDIDSCFGVSRKFTRGGGMALSMPLVMSMIFPQSIVTSAEVPFEPARSNR